MKEQLMPVEVIKNKDNRYGFITLKPGGNDTALVIGEVADKASRKVINDSLMSIYPNIEQVGFIYTDEKEDLNLMMAGGEFCGNATRSAAYLALEGKPGDLEIKVSGVEGNLKAGVKENGDAYAQMPIYKETSKIVNDPENPDAWLVNMQGISQYVVFCDQSPTNKNPDELKKEAMEILEVKDLKLLPAAGVIYASKDEGNWRIDPIVYVRDINTNFYETACGSGTTALGQVLALREKQSVNNIPILQPSGETINISVDFDGNEFGYAQISGKVELLTQGVIREYENDGPYTIETVLTEGSLKKNLKEDGVIWLYKEVFGDEPYLEVFTDEEVEGYFQEYFQNGVILLARDKGKIVGFAASVDVISEPKIAKIAAGNGINPENCTYIAELGVQKGCRRKKVGINLIEELLLQTPDKLQLLRTAKDNIPAQNLYRQLGFVIVPAMTESITRDRTNEKERTDDRIFMIKSL